MAGGVDTGVRLALLALACLAGAGAQLSQSALWPVPVYLVLVGLSACALAVLRHRAVAAAVALCVLVFGATGWRAQDRLSDRLAPALEGQDLMLTGVVASLPRQGPTGLRFEFAVDSPPPGAPRRISLAWYRPANAEAPRLDLRAGQRWQFIVRLRQPHGNLNPHGFDLELWLFERGIGASGYVRNEAQARKLAEVAGHPVERLRQHLRDAIEARVPDDRAAGVLAALVVGDQGAIDRGDWDLFRTTGIAHLVSISGLHVTMFAWLAAAVIGWAWRRSARLSLWWPTPLAARWGGLVLAVAYAVLAGWGVPAQRTVWMIAGVVLLRTLGLRWPLPLVLLAVAALVTLIDPWALLQPGFWLSFVAVALLIASQPAARPPAPDAGWPARARRAAAIGIRTQAVATVGLAPLTLLFFQQLSLVGFVANLIAIPLVTLFITPLALAGALWPALWTLAAMGVQGLSAILALLAQWPLAVWTAAAAPWWVAGAGLLGGALLVLPLPWRLRALGLPLLLPLLWPAVPRPADGRMEVVVVDVGQGTAVLLRTRRHLLVYDSGPQYSAEVDAGDRVLLPLLRARGERRIDLLMLSHRDSDHVGGAASLLAGLPVAAVSSSLADDHPLRAADAVAPALRGRRPLGLGRRALRGAAPGCRPAGLRAAARQRPELCAAGAGCAGALDPADRRHRSGAGGGPAAARRARRLRSTVLLVPHHGSRTSSSAAFLDAVAPALAVVQAGYRSRFGHPAPEVVARYEERGIPLRRSDRCGAWSWTGDDAGRCEREVARRYWHHGP